MRNSLWMILMGLFVLSQNQSTHGLTMVEAIDFYLFQSTSLISGTGAPPFIFNVPFPAQAVFTSTPLVLSSLFRIEWTYHLSFDYSVTATSTQLQITILTNTTSDLFQIIFNHLTVNSSIYKITQQTFLYEQDPTTWDYTVDQSILVTNQVKYMFSMLTAYEDKNTPLRTADFLPIVTVVDQLTFGSQYEITIPANSGYMIVRLKLRMIILGALPYTDEFYVSSVISVYNGPNALGSTISTWVTMAPDSVYYGLQIIKLFNSLEQTAILQLTLGGTFTENSAQLEAFVYLLFYYPCTIDQPYLLDNVSSKLCVPACPSDYWVTSYKECLTCQAPCLTCQYSSTNCTSCPDHLILGYEPLANQNRCNCPEGQYQISAGVCELCTTPMSDCLTCDSDTVCTSCGESLSLKLDNSGCECVLGSQVTNAEGKRRCVRSKSKQECPPTMILSGQGYGCRCPLGLSLIGGICI